MKEPIIINIMPDVYCPPGMAYMMCNPKDRAIIEGILEHLEELERREAQGFFKRIKGFLAKKMGLEHLPPRA